jgi:hypothetical protein
MVIWRTMPCQTRLVAAQMVATPGGIAMTRVLAILPSPSMTNSSDLITGMYTVYLPVFSSHPCVNFFIGFYNYRFINAQMRAMDAKHQRYQVTCRIVAWQRYAMLLQNVVVVEISTFIAVSGNSPQIRLSLGYVCVCVCVCVQ